MVVLFKLENILEFYAQAIPEILGPNAVLSGLLLEYVDLMPRRRCCRGRLSARLLLLPPHGPLLLLGLFRCWGPFRHP